jgi:nucleoside-diphosphate-sugar epimerase
MAKTQARKDKAPSVASAKTEVKKNTATTKAKASDAKKKTSVAKSKPKAASKAVSVSKAKNAAGARGTSKSRSAAKSDGSWLLNLRNKSRVELEGKTILVTGSPGFVGANLVLRLLKEMKTGTVISFDNMNDYYNPTLKEYRLKLIDEAVAKSGVNHLFIRGSIADAPLVERVMSSYRPDVVVNLAAQAGVRYSIDHPEVYVESNLVGFFNILEACRRYPVEHLVYASSSSVYGGNKKIPFAVDDKVDHPVSLYAATKKSNELLAHCYSKLYDIPTTGLRFFTVYGPAGRPDMFYFSAAKKLVSRNVIQLYNYGNCRRDFTYIDDIVEGVFRVMQGAPEKKKGDDGLPIPPYAVYNIGGGTPENLLDFVSTLQEELVRAKVLPKNFDFEAYRELVPMQPGDVPETYADSRALEEDYGFRPTIGIREGLRRFAEWFYEYRRRYGDKD